MRSNLTYKKSLKDITPQAYKCVVGACPTVYETEEGNLIIIGTKLSETDFEGMVAPEKIAENETAIVIPRELLDGMK